jgi:thiamine pyrophosphokinase
LLRALKGGGKISHHFYTTSAAERDSATAAAYESEGVAGYWDSWPRPGRALRELPHLTLPHEKDRSDLHYALLLAYEAGAREVVCLGVTGGRADHHLASLGELALFAEEMPGIRSVCAAGPEGDYFFLSRRIPRWQARLAKGRLVSAFSWNGPATGVTLQGFHYELRSARLESGSHGLSNEVVRPRVSISLRGGRLIVVVPA